MKNTDETLVLSPLVWHNEKRKIKDLVSYEFNPRILTENKKKDLIASLEKFNLAEVPAINTDNKIVAGHQRVKILIHLGRGEETIDVRVPNRSLTDAEFKEYNITSNVSVGFWDTDVLEEHFADIDLESLGLDVEDIVIPDDILPEELKTEEEEEFDPEPPKEAISILGDQFEFISKQKGLHHRLLCGDSTCSDTVSKLMNGKKADMVFTDPPYGIEIVGENGKIGCEKLAKAGTYSKVIGDDTTDTTRYFYNTCVSLGMDKFIIWGGNYFVDFLPYSPSWIIWDKRGDMNSNNFADGEMAWCSFHTRVRIYKQLWSGMIKEGEKGKRVHPTQKPIRMLSQIIEDHIKGDFIFDGFLGSGSTLIACEQTTRNCYGMELDPIYIDVITRRWLKYMNDNNLEFEIRKNGELLTQEIINKFLEA